MPILLLKIARWLVGKGIFLLGIAAVAVAVFALWIFATRSYSGEESRVDELSQLQGQATEVYAELESAHQRLIELGEDLDRTRRKIEAANRSIAYLDGLLRRIGRFFTMSALEREQTEQQLQRARAEREEQVDLRSELVAEQSRLRVDRVRLSETAKDLEAKIDALEARSSGFVQNLGESWRTLKPYLIVALASAIVLPIAWKLIAFYVWAPLLSLAGPIRLHGEALPTPSVSAKGVSVQVALQPGQILWVKESYLQASDESLKRQTRFVLNWAIPATCLAAGLVEMIQLSSAERAGKITVSPQKRAELEIALLELPAGGQMVARPSSVAGLVSRDGEPVEIRRRWRLFHPQAWLTFQFRYFIFQGPCSLIVSGVRGVRFERLDTEQDKGRRSNQIATIGFTPDLRYGVTRAETFWSYFRKFNPLFDDVFRGQGAFLCQEISEEDATKAGRFWANLWNGALKVLGI